MSNRLGGQQGTAYLGTNANQPPNMRFENRAPTQYDYADVTVGDEWLDESTGDVYKLISLEGDSTSRGYLAHWVLLVSSDGNLERLTASDFTFSVPVNGNISFPDTTILGSGTVDSNLQSTATAGIFVFNVKPAIKLPVTNAAGTQGMLYIGPNRFVHGYGTANTFLGNAAGNTNLTTISATSNTGVGNAALLSLTTGQNNAAVGSLALQLNDTGSFNTMMGTQAGSFITTGTGNTGLGSGALVNGIISGLTTGSRNIAIGLDTGSSYSGAESNNILINNVGSNGESNKIKIGTFGSGAGQQNETFLYGGTVNIPNGNVVLPTTTATAGQVKIGTNRFLHGYGTSNTFVGDAAGNTTLTGIENASCGTATLQVLSSGSNNTAMGWASLIATNTGSNNTALGSGVMTSLTTGSNNTGLGGGAFAQVGSGLVTGSNNLGLGWDAGSNYTGAESSNILLLNDGTVGESNTIRIGTNGAGAGQQNRCFIAGIRGVTTGVADAIAILIDSAHQLGTVSSSIKYKQNIHDLADDSSIIYDLRPVKFNYKKHPDVPAWGLIAEEVQEVFPQLVVYKDSEPETVKYHDLPVLLLNEIQKLNKRVKELEEKSCVCAKVS